MIRVVLPAHLRILAKVEGEVCFHLAIEPTLAAVLDQLEIHHPNLKGTIRDQVTKKRRPFVRFFACQTDISQEPQEMLLPPLVCQGIEPLLIVGAIAGGKCRELAS